MKHEFVIENLKRLDDSALKAMKLVASGDLSAAYIEIAGIEGLCKGTREIIEVEILGVRQSKKVDLLGALKNLERCSGGEVINMYAASHADDLAKCREDARSVISKYEGSLR